MEEPQSNLAPQHIDIVHSIHRMKSTPSVSPSPEHCRARSKVIRAGGQPTNADRRPQIRRRESYTDGTRRGRSRTRSISPQSAKRRDMRRRRSRSPSRSCSTSVTETPSLSLERPRNSGAQTSDESPKGKTRGVVAWDSSRESMRTRSKRRKKYRRRSDYAATTADVAQNTQLQTLRDVSSATSADKGADVSPKEGAHERMENFESVVEEDEYVHGAGRE